MADGKLKFTITVDGNGNAIIKDMNGNIQKVQKTSVAATSKMSKGFAGLWKQMAGAGLAIAGLRALQRAISDVVNDTIIFEKEFANVTTLLDSEGIQSAKMMEEGLLDMAGALGSAEELTKGLYQTLSAGVTPGVQAMQFLESSAKFAQAGLIDMATSVDVLSTVVNAYGLEVEKAGWVSDVLFQTIKDGKITGQELAASLGRVIPTASTLNIGLEQVSAAIAVMTKAGIKSEEAVTSLNASFVSLLKPQGASLKLAKQYGIELSKAGIEAKEGGFQEWLADIKDKLGDNEKAMATLFPNIRALKAIFTLTGTSAKEYADQMERNKDVADNVNEAFEKQISTFAGVSEAIKNQLSASITKALLPALKGVATWMKESMPEIQSGFKTLIEIISAFAQVIGKAFSIAGSVIGGFVDWIKTNMPATSAVISNIVNGWRNLLVLFNGEYAKSQDQVMSAINRSAQVEKQAITRYREMRDTLKLTSGQLNTFSKDFNHISDIGIRYNKIMQAIRDGKYGEKLAQDFKDMKAGSDGLTDSQRKLLKEMEAAEKATKKYNEALKDQIKLSKDIQKVFDNTKNSLHKITTETKFLEDADKSLNDELENGIELGGDWVDIVKDMADGAKAVAKKLAELEKRTAEFNNSVDFLFNSLIDITSLISEDLSNAIVDMGNVFAKAISGDWIGAIAGAIPALMSLGDAIWGLTLNARSYEEIQASIAETLAMWEKMAESTGKTVEELMTEAFENGLEVWGIDYEQFLKNLEIDTKNTFGIISSIIAGTFDTIGDLIAPGITPTAPEEAIKPGRGFASGGSFIIPPGYNENFQLGNVGAASSGEEVTITPANQVNNNNSRGPVTFNVFPAPGESDTELANRLVNMYNNNEGNMQGAF